MSETGIIPQVRVREGGDRLAIYGRKDSRGTSKWITIKNSQAQNVNFHIQVQDLLANTKYSVTNLLSFEHTILTGQEIRTSGFPGSLNANGSTVYFIQKQ